ncbi:alpha/beta hydrolase [Frigidibacter sp. MR17.24]|uniref:alpha/beta hydrolase n=1 Tax=Frigidibacter sp. MR17.24 TaxID=3127345 RepID=UPI003012F84C
MTYRDHLDDEIRAFIAATAAHYTEALAPDDIEGQRRVYDAMARAFHHGYPDGVAALDGTIAGVPVRRYGPGAGAAFGAGGPVVLYLHGGGFVLGGLDSHDDVCAEIAAATGLEVIAADYRLAPEHVHPAQVDDALAVARALAAEGPILLCGDSAGGTLAAAVAAEIRASVAGVVLIYPSLGLHAPPYPPDSSLVRQARAPMLTTADMEAYARLRFGGDPVPDPRAFPLLGDDFAGMPPVLALAAECDPLADDVPAYVARLRAAGVEAEGAVEPGLVHGHLRARHRSAKAAASFARVCAALAEFAARPARGGGGATGAAETA